MLDFALKYQPAIMEFTSNLKFGLRKFELDNEEWELAKQLRDVLKVREHYYLSCYCIHSCLGLLRWHSILLTEETDAVRSTPGNGHHRRSFDGRVH